MIRSDENWIALCEQDEEGRICFTKEYLDVTKDLGGGARKFAALLITHWNKDFQSLLDYFGPEDLEEDLYSGIDGEPMDVREDVTDVWAYYGEPFDGFDGEWYRDILRSKLITFKLPERLIKEYVRIAKENMKGI
jgi:hypothetical protein